MILTNYTWIGIHLIWILGLFLYSKLLKDSKAFALNRTALYAILVVPFLLLFSTLYIEGPVVFSKLPELKLYESISVNNPAERIGLIDFKIISILYFLIAGIFGIRFILELVQIFKMKRSSKKIACEFGEYYEIKGTGAFCFFGWIFIGREQTNKELAYNHEKIHAKALHSVDILLIRMMSIVFWLFPFWKMIEKYFKQNHEYYVDGKLLDKGHLNLKQYVASIVDDGLSEFRFNTLSGMYQLSLIKNRIEMMKSTNKFKLWKNVAFMVILFSGICMVSCQLDSQEDGSEITNFALLDVAPKVEVEGCEDESMECFNKYLIEHLQKEFTYPKDAKEQGIEGKSYVEFIIDKTAAIVDVNLVKSSGNELLDEEAIRLVNSLPDILEAGMKDGKHVNTKYTLPVSFILKK